METNQKLTHVEIITKIDQLLAAQMEIDAATLKPEVHLFDGLGMDSLDAIDLVMAIHKEFKVKPEEQELQALRHLGDVHTLVQKYYDKIN